MQKSKHLLRGSVVKTMDFPHSSVGKESACSAGDLCLIPGSERSPGEGNGNPLQYSCPEKATDRGAWQATGHGVARVGHDLATKPPPQSVVKNPPASAGDARDTGSIPGLGRSPGGGRGNPPQYSYLENPMDGGA